MVLLTAFTSVADVAHMYAGSRLAQMTFGSLFMNSNMIRQVSCPAIFIHGVADDVVPMMHSARLFELCSTKKLLVTPSNFAHNSDPFDHPEDVVQPVMRFFDLPSSAGGPPRLPHSAFQRPVCLVEATHRLAAPRAWGCERLTHHTPSAGGDEVHADAEETFTCRATAMSAKDPFCGRWARRLSSRSSVR